MRLGKLFRIFKKNKANEQIAHWLKIQSHPEDAMLYLIEKEIFENGERDLSYVIPRVRNDAYFESVSGQYNYVAPPSNAEPIRLETHKKRRKSIPQAEGALAQKTLQDVTKVRGQSLVSVNKSSHVMHDSSVVITAPDDEFYNTKSDMTCFDD